MLKRIVLGVLFCFLCLGNVKADTETEVVKFYTIKAGASASTTYIPITTIVPEQSRILGFSVNSDSTAVSQGALWDETSSTTHHEDNMFGEISNPASNSDMRIFPYPKKITRQVRVTLTAASSMIIYYTK